MNNIIDITKPVVTSDGFPAKIIASGLTGAIPGVAAPYMGGETLLIQNDAGNLEYTLPDGSIFEGSSIHFRNAPERTSEFRTVNFKSNQYPYGGMLCETLKQAQELIYPGSSWEGVAEFVKIDDKVVDLKFHPAA